MPRHRRHLPLLLLAATLAGAGCATTEKAGRALGLGGTSAAPAPEVRLAGVEGEMQRSVRAHLSLAGEPCDAPRWRVRQRFERARAEIARALRAFGYYQAEAEGDLDTGEPCWSASFRITPGTPVRIASVELSVRGEASDDPAFDALLGSLPLEEGAVLNHARYEQAKQDIAALGAERGYLDGAFTTHQMLVDPDQHSARIRLEYDSGPRYRFGRVHLEQQALAEDLVRRFVTLEEGTPYDSRRLTELSSALNDSGYFRRVEVRPELEAARDREVPVEVRLEARPQHAFSTGLGVATDTGPRGRVRYDNYLLNRRGHRLSAHVAASLIDVDSGVDYRIPLADPRSEWLSFQAGYRREHTNEVRSDVFKIGARRTQTRFRDWLETQFVELSREDFDVGSDSGIATLVVPGMSWTRTEADNQLRPRRGYRLRFEVRGSHELLGSDTSFLQLRGSAKWIHGFRWGGRVLARADTGWTAVDQFDVLPPSQRFFAGGDSSVRGYGYRNLGPRDSEGQVVGGQFLLTGSLEYEHPVTERWGVAVFVDSGNAFDSLDAGLKTGAGLGLRWHSPIGPVRLDVAYPFDDPDQLFRIHISMGPDL